MTKSEKYALWWFTVRILEDNPQGAFNCLVNFLPEPAMQETLVKYLNTHYIKSELKESARPVRPLVATRDVPADSSSSDDLPF